MTGYNPQPPSNVVTIDGVDLVAEVLCSSFSYATQNPSGLDIPTKIIYSGANVSDEYCSILANGNVVFNKSGTYNIALTQTLGRTGAGGAAHLITWGEIDFGAGSVQVVNSVGYELDNANIRMSLQFSNFATVQAGWVLTAWMARNSTGTNEGGLYSRTASAALLAEGIQSVPSAGIVISALRPVVITI